VKGFYKRNRKTVIWVLVIFLLTALVWAGNELAGQANARAQDAGSSSYEIEKMSYETIKKPRTSPNCDWKLERALDKKIRNNDEQYGSLVTTAKADVSSSGKVSSGTSKKVLDLASDYKSLMDKYSDMWGSCKCVTRSNTAKSLGKSRVKTAAVIVSELDQAKLNEMNSAQAELKASRREYAEQARAKNEISIEDKVTIQKTVLPRANDLVANIANLVQSVINLLSDVSQTVSEASGGGLIGCAKAVSSVPRLLSDVQTLLTIVKSLSSDAEALVTDANTLSE
jgi:hypothetical protein